MIIGLGNPGAEYEGTRHNVGFWLADALVARWRLPKWSKDGPSLVSGGQTPFGKVYVMKPQTFMNASGKVLSGLRAPTPGDSLPDLLIMVDDFALPAGAYRIRGSGSAGGHNGLKSVEESLGTTIYPRLRIGVGPKPKFADQADFVLDEVPADDRKLIEELMPEMCEAVEAWAGGGIAQAMNRYNKKLKKEEE